jgi:hypothetical protein
MWSNSIFRTFSTLISVTRKTVNVIMWVTILTTSMDRIVEFIIWTGGTFGGSGSITGTIGTIVSGRFTSITFEVTWITFVGRVFNISSHTWTFWSWVSFGNYTSGTSFTISTFRTLVWTWITDLG